MIAEFKDSLIHEIGHHIDKGVSNSTYWRSVITKDKTYVSEYAKNSIVDSSTENHEILGKSFHLYLPEKLIYGYPWTRNGEVIIEKGTCLDCERSERYG